MALLFAVLQLCVLIATAHAGVIKVNNDVIRRSDDITPLETLVMQQGQLITQMQATITSLNAQIIALQSKTDSALQLVVFMVDLAANQDLTHNPHLNYGNPTLNVGNGFNTNTDTFVAPVSGLYVFFVKCSAPDGQVGYITFGLKLEGNVIAETETNDNDNVDRASVQVIVQVHKGQHLWVEKIGGGDNIVDGGILTTFGGYLLKAGESF